jgi:hypothetical protein
MNLVFERLAPGRPRHPDTVEILEMRRQGKTYGQIKEWLGVPRSTISTICQWDDNCKICSPAPCSGKHKRGNKT